MKIIVYVVEVECWRKGLGDWPDDYSGYMDSIWTNKEDAQRRIDDLSNEYIRSKWYEWGAWDSELFIEELYVGLNKEGVMIAKTDDYEEERYFVNEVTVNPILKDFEGP